MACSLSTGAQRQGILTQRPLAGRVSVHRPASPLCPASPVSSPPKSDAPPTPLEELFEFDPATRCSYQSVEDDDLAWVEVQRLVKCGFLLPFDELEACTAFLGGPPVVSKFGMVVKDKVLPDGSSKTKRRLILDSKESGVSAGSAHPQRIILPDLTDLVQDLVDMSLSSTDPPHIAITDFVDAFWNLGLNPAERRFFVGKLRGVYFVFLALAQGSRSAPLCGVGLLRCSPV